jgi:osmoprotectant transport system permease protein
MSPATLVLADAFDDFKDAISFIFNERESVSGGIQVGGSELWGLMGTHVLISTLAVVAAVAISVPIGLWLGHKGKGEFVAISISNIGRAVPTLALLAFFIAYLGVGVLNVTVCLTLLAIPPILTNTFVGVRQVEREAVDSARGQGMTEGQIIRKVELPLAVNTIFGGIRISAVNVVATATIAPLASVETLGRPIINSNVYGFAGTLGAAILVALLALVVGQALAALQYAVTPKGLKVQGGASAPRRRFSLTRLWGGQPT